jgi:hypothetical protein
VRKYPMTIANIEIAMFELEGGLLQAREIPLRISLGTEKLTVHVIVHSGDGIPLTVEILHGPGEPISLLLPLVSAVVVRKR